MVDDDGRPVALEVFDGRPKILEVHAAAVQVDRGVAGSSPEQPERNAETDDAAVGRIESKQVQVVRDGCVPRRRPIGVSGGIRRGQARSEVSVRRSSPSPPRALARGRGCRRRFGFDVLGNEVETNRGDRREAENA